MAQPYIEGDKTSIIYGSNECNVLKENILIELEEYEPNLYFANYTIEYFISSKVNQKLPLVFYGINLEKMHSITVNGLRTKFDNSNSNTTRKIYFDSTEYLNVQGKQLIYFDAHLIEGTNKIILSYTGSLGHNTYGFTQNNDIVYSLYPSKFWKSFGKINVELTADKEIEIISSNLGNYLKNGNTFQWEIDKIENDNIEVSVRKKTSLLSKILLFIQPFGIALILTLVLAFIHYLSINQKYKFNKYKYSLSIGNFLVPIFFFVFYLLSFGWIDYSLGQENSRHGYAFLIVILLPFVWLIYGLLMFLIDKGIKMKTNYKKLPPTLVTVAQLLFLVQFL